MAVRWLLCCCFFVFTVKAKINITLTKSTEHVWSVTYQSDKPINKIQLYKTLDNSRAKRWYPEPGFTLRHQNGNDFILKEDDSAFTQVTVQLTSTYWSLPKEYAPFSPFSDGGMLLHSRRFFACAERCTAESKRWSFNLVMPADDYAIVQGQLSKNPEPWIESGWGSKIYVGPSKPLEGDSFLLVIDEQLPESFRVQLNSSLPLLLNWFSSRMEPLQEKAMLFASYSDEQGGYGYQGGTLGKQVFFHWYGQKSVESLKPEEIHWFIAHEIAHFFQKDSFESEASEDSWIAEGSAEWMAALAMEKVFKQHGYVEQQLLQAESSCKTGLKASESFNDLLKSDLDAGYYCGLLVFQAIENDLKAHNSAIKSVPAVWEALAKYVSDNQVKDSKDFLLFLQPHLSSAFDTQLQALILDGDLGLIMESE